MTIVSASLPILWRHSLAPQLHLPAPCPPGPGPPADAHCLNRATNTSCGTDTGSRSPPGCQPHNTSESSLTCLVNASKLRPPLAFLSLIISQSAVEESPIHAILWSGGGSPQWGAPGGASG